MDTMLERKRQEGIQEERKMLKKRLLELGISPELLKKAYSTASK